MQYLNTGMQTRGGSRFRTQLDGREYLLELVWSEGEGVWLLNIRNASGTVLQAGLVLRHGVNVLAPFTSSELPGEGLGELFAWDASNQNRDPGRTDLVRSSSVRLIYRTRVEVLARGGS
jgi:hypothetical protein